MSLFYRPVGIQADLRELMASYGVMPAEPESIIESGRYLLQNRGHGLELSSDVNKSIMSISVDFTSGVTKHRLDFGGGKGQSIAKAIGLGKGVTPSVLDATAGMGSDAFVLASLGCRVTLLERSVAVWLLLYDGLTRGRSCGDEKVVAIIDRMTLIAGDAVTYMINREQKSIDVVYLDPMFPMRKKKSALVKKNMQVFHSLVGGDEDADALLEPALAVAEHRVVVKRPRIAPFLAGRSPSFSLEGKSSRFDIYTLKKF